MGSAISGSGAETFSGRVSSDSMKTAGGGREGRSLGREQRNNQNWRESRPEEFSCCLGNQSGSPLKPTLSPQPLPSNNNTQPASCSPLCLLFSTPVCSLRQRRNFHIQAHSQKHTLLLAQSRACRDTHPGSGGCHPGGCTGGGSPSRGGCWRPARPVGGWWWRARSGGWSLPGWRTGWPHRSCVPSVCCLPSF